jgi:hypothetical protein
MSDRAMSEHGRSSDDRRSEHRRSSDHRRSFKDLLTALGWAMGAMIATFNLNVAWIEYCTAHTNLTAALRGASQPQPIRLPRAPAVLVFQESSRRTYLLGPYGRTYPLGPYEQSGPQVLKPADWHGQIPHFARQGASAALQGPISLGPEVRREIWAVLERESRPHPTAGREASRPLRKLSGCPDQGHPVRQIATATLGRELAVCLTKALK